MVQLPKTRTRSDGGANATDNGGGFFDDPLGAWYFGPMISVDRISVRHPNGFESLREVSLRIPTGSLVYVLGRAGAGKTTLLDIIGGMTRPTAGTIAVGGVDLMSLSDQALALRRRRIGQLWRTPHLHPDLTIGQNVRLPLDLRDIPKDDRELRVESALETVGLSNHRDTKPIWLNRLEQQRVSVARMIAMEPEIILADEPMALLDRESAAELELLLSQLATAARTVIIATQNREDTPPRRRARVILLNKGFLIDDQQAESPRS